MCVAQNKYSRLRSLGGGSLSSPPGQLKLCSRLFRVIMQLGRTSTSNWFAKCLINKDNLIKFLIKKICHIRPNGGTQLSSFLQDSSEHKASFTHMFVNYVQNYVQNKPRGKSNTCLKLVSESEQSKETVIA